MASTEFWTEQKVTDSKKSISIIKNVLNYINSKQVTFVYTGQFHQHFTGFFSPIYFSFLKVETQIEKSENLHTTLFY